MVLLTPAVFALTLLMSSSHVVDIASKTVPILTPTELKAAPDADALQIAQEDSDELGMTLAVGCELLRDIKKDAQFEKARLSIGQLGQVVADACAEQNAKGFEQHELRLIQTLATNGPLILAQIKLEETEMIQISNGQNVKKKAKKLAEFDAYLNNELPHGPLKDGLNELLRAKEHLMPSDLLAFLLNKMNTFGGHNQEGIRGGKMAEKSPEKVVAARPPPPPTTATTTVHQRRTRRSVKLIAAFTFVMMGLLTRNMGMIVLGYWLFICWWILG